MNVRNKTRLRKRPARSHGGATRLQEVAQVDRSGSRRSCSQRAELRVGWLEFPSNRFQKDEKRLKPFCQLMEGFAVFDPFFNAALFKKTCLKKVLHATQLMRMWDSSPSSSMFVLCGRSWRPKRTKLSPLHPNQKTDF